MTKRILAQVNIYIKHYKICVSEWVSVACVCVWLGKCGWIIECDITPLNFELLYVLAFYIHI